MHCSCKLKEFLALAGCLSFKVFLFHFGLAAALISKREETNGAVTENGRRDVPNPRKLEQNEYKSGLNARFAESTPWIRAARQP